MRSYLILVAVFTGFYFSAANAEDAVLTQSECADILQSWAESPKSVAKDLVERCQNSISLIEPAAGMAAVDPCAGPGAGSLVLCWGPWSSLAPAAGAVAPTTDLAGIYEFEGRPELASTLGVGAGDLTPEIPVLPLGSCTPGAGCGFASVVDGPSADAPAGDTSIARYDMASDASQFVIGAGGAGQISSVTDMSARYADRTDEYETMTSQGIDGGQRSRLIARVIRGGNGEVEQAADLWASGNTAAGGQVNSGYFAWGKVTSQADLDQLNASMSPRSINYSGLMSVDNRTTGNITVNFGAQPNWSGNWTNPGYTFDAGGPVSGADMISQAGQFSSNVTGNSYVQGVLLGGEGNRGVAHTIDVELTGAGRIKDVGLLREIK